MLAPTTSLYLPTSRLGHWPHSMVIRNGSHVSGVHSRHVFCNTAAVRKSVQRVICNTWSSGIFFVGMIPRELCQLNRKNHARFESCSNYVMATTPKKSMIALLHFQQPHDQLTETKLCMDASAIGRSLDPTKNRCIRIGPARGLHL